MSHGVAGVLTLYDDKGNPIKVRLVDGEYQLVTHDEGIHDRLDQIIVLLDTMVELLQKR